MKDESKQWHWQESGTAWKGVGIYHVTLTVPSREPLLGKLVISDNDSKQARVERTELGNRIRDCVEEIPCLHPEIKIIQQRMMPDHLHVILYVTRPMDVSIKMVVRGLWQGAKKLGREYSLSIDPESDSGTRDKVYSFPNFFAACHKLRTTERILMFIGRVTCKIACR